MLLRSAIRVLLSVLLATPGLEANLPDAGQAMAARALAYEARAAYEAEDYVRAQRLASEAYRLVPAPTIALLEARALVQLEAWLRARDRFELAAMPVGPDAPEAFRRARAAALRELLELEKQLPTLRIVVEPEPTDVDALQLQLDGELLDTSFIGIPFFRDPGAHQLRYIEGGEERTRQFMLERRKRHVVVVDVTKDTDPLHDVQASTSTQEQAVDWKPYAGWAAVGLSAAGVATGVVMGLRAVHYQDQLEQSCRGSDCPVGAADDLERYRLTRDVSTASYLVGAAAAASGVVLLLSADTDTEPGRREVAVGPGQIQFRGTF